MIIDGGFTALSWMPIRRIEVKRFIKKVEMHVMYKCVFRVGEC